MHKITADGLFTGQGEILKNFVLVFDKTGEILDIERDVQVIEPDVERLSGWVTPGFINAHCHLELSHMRGLVATGTGLIDFVSEVVTKRDADEDVILSAISQAEKEMIDQGIVAVGDISNTTDSFVQKRLGRLHYTTFIEMFDLFQPEDAQKTFRNYYNVYQACPADAMNARNIVPHAPYSVSPALFRLIRAHQSDVVSIHNQEIEDENTLFLNKGGGFPAWFESFGLTLDHFEPTRQTSIHYALAELEASTPTIFVHNTQTNSDDVRSAMKWNDQTYWCTCPNANLYIENRLPDYHMFLDLGAIMVIGTDSLTSNWQLSILEEIKTIRKYASYVPTVELLKWSTKNGAKALKIDDRFGEIRIGRRPGINLISCITEGEITANSEVIRLA